MFITVKCEGLIRFRRHPRHPALLPYLRTDARFAPVLSALGRCSCNICNSRNICHGCHICNICNGGQHPSSAPALATHQARPPISGRRSYRMLAAHSAMRSRTCSHAPGALGATPRPLRKAAPRTIHASCSLYPCAPLLLQLIVIDQYISVSSSTSDPDYKAER